MNKDMLVRKTADITGFKIKDVKDVLEAMNTVKKDALKKGEEVKDGLVTIKTVETKARDFRNPKTGEPIHKEAGHKLKIKATSALNEVLAN